MLLGYLTFTGSLMAAGKLQEVLPTRPITYRNQNFINLTLFAIALGIGIRLILVPTDTYLFPFFAGLALVFGVLLIIPDRRRGHAYGDRAAELLRRSFRLRHGIRAEQ